MSGFARIKRVADPLNQIVKSRIFPDDTSSGSEHDAVSPSPSLSDLVNGFLVGDSGTESPELDSDSEPDPLAHDSVGAIDDPMDPIANLNINNADPFRNMLYCNVTKAVEVFSSVTPEQLRRSVMAFLRNLGYNAAVCKTKWEDSGGLTAGNYEFIDVLRSDSLNRLTRYFVDLDFSKEFEIARPTPKYEHAVLSMPKVFVGQNEELKQVLKAMSDAARRSLKSRGLHLPPWRKHRYMQNKWLGPYKRTTNLFPAVKTPVFPPSHPPALKQNNFGAVKCRSVGFDVNPTSNGRFLLFPAAPAPDGL